MNAKKQLFALLLMLISIGTSMMTAQEIPLIPVDTAVRIGKLDCGLTYYIRYNNYPENRVDFYIAQRVGSLQEEENQRGLAHFLEHMAFNGSEHFNGEGKGIIDYTTSLGLKFGLDINASTNIAETVYNINDVPSTRQSALDSCLLILKDWSGGLLLTDEEIDKERGVIKEEWRMRRTALQRMLERQLETLYPDSKYGRRMPIGLMSVVDSFPYQDLRDYYHKWYRPDNQAIVVVGDVDVDHIEAKIKELFKDCVLDPNAPQVTEEPVPDNEQPIIVIDKDKEQMMNVVMINFKHDVVDKEYKKTMAYWSENYLKMIMTQMLNSRMSEKTQEPDCPYLMASGSDGYYMLSKSKGAFNLSCIPKEGMTEKAIQTIVSEAMSAVKYGFTETEFERTKESLMRSAEMSYIQRDQTFNTLYSATLYRNFLDGEPITSIEQDYEMTKQFLPTITVDDINAILPQYITTDGRNLVIVSFNQEKEDAVYPTPEGLKAAVDAGLNADVQAFVDNFKDEPLIANMPKKGKIKKERLNKLFEFKDLELSNGVRVILKKTDLKKDEIWVNALARGGMSSYGEEDRANLELLNEIRSISALGNFTRTELKKAMAGKMAFLSNSTAPNYDLMTGSTNAMDLETVFQLIYLNFTDIRKDEKNFNKMMTQQEALLKNRDLTPETAYSDSLSLTLSSHNWRSWPFTVDDLKLVDYDRTLEIIKERTANAANFTFFIIGDFDEDAIRPLIEQYIASLPAKKGKKSNWVNHDNYPTGQVINHFTHKMEEPKAYTTIYWYNKEMPYSLENEIKADLLGSLLDKIYRQKIREDAGAAYSTSAGGWAGYHGDYPFTSISVQCPVKPEFTDSALMIINDELIKACSQIDAASLEDFKENMLKNHESFIKENIYWMSILEDYVDRGIDKRTNYVDIIKAQTPESIATFAREFLSAANKVEVVMTPEPQ